MLIENIKMYIEDEIGEEYMRWESGDTIYISAPAGSGNSHFIL